MSNLTTKYMGLELKNPIIVGSCGLTRKVDTVQKCEEAGAGAVVLKSIFEEAIAHEVGKEMKAAENQSQWHPEAMEYVQTYAKENQVGRYLDLIADCKAKTSLPIIASVHCVSATAWPEFVVRAQSAGADAVELNAFVLPSDLGRDAAATEQIYFDLAAAIDGKLNIPVALKLGSYFSSLSHTVTALSKKVQGITLFNRFFNTDIDVDNLELTKAGFLSDPGEYLLPLRWISLLHGRSDCDLCATTGIHDARTVAKLLLAGASTCQLVSTLYKNGVNHIEPIVKQLESWMDEHSFATIDEFRGKLSQSTSDNPAAFERVQFMKFSAGIE